MASRRPPIAGGTPIFERIAVYAPVFNLALIYRGSLLLCAMMPANTPLLANPAEGRLTVANILSVKRAVHSADRSPCRRPRTETLIAGFHECAA